MKRDKKLARMKRALVRHQAWLLAVRRWGSQKDVAAQEALVLNAARNVEKRAQRT